MNQFVLLAGRKKVMELIFIFFFISLIHIFFLAKDKNIVSSLLVD
jgi:hypothetical protein